MWLWHLVFSFLSHGLFLEIQTDSTLARFCKTSTEKIESRIPKLLDDKDL
jgi:hypothetical protein